MMRIPMRRISELTLGVFASVALTTTASAVVVINNSQNIAPAGGAVHAVHDPASAGTPTLLSASSSDLAQGLTAAVTYTGGTGNVQIEMAAGVSAFTNGSITTVYNESGPNGNAIDHAAYGAVHGTTTINSFVTFNLGALYDLTRVDVFLGWPDSGRDDSSFILRASTDGVNYANLATYTKGPDNTGAITTPVTNLHSVVDSLGADMAPAIQYVQLQFTDADNGYAGLAEVDIFGETPTFDIADVNRDGDVDIDDFYVISNNFLKVPSALGLDGDIVADNFVDAADFRLWKNSVSPGLLAQINGSNVPEPATVVTLAVAAGLGLVVRRYRQA
ncbi:hypothetical protein [Aeoliella sp. SH292]|uniref:hypothetical protein n=1 Tax=Aeoliella sp. SH292 TaxID=3454464 RepID=UPI003F9EA34E